MTEDKPHEALGVPLAERVDYLTIIASMAGVDVVLTSEELDKLRQLCRTLELPETDPERVLATAHRPTATIERHLDALKGSHLRFTLLADCLALAYADGEYSKGERKEIHALARALDIDDAQVSALEEAGEALRQAAEHAHEHQHVKHLAERLAAVGVPVGLVASLSAIGLSTAGVSTGAASLLLGLGVATGFGAALGLGLGTMMGVKWLHDKITDVEEPSGSALSPQDERIGQQLLDRRPLRTARGVLTI